MQARPPLHSNNPHPPLAPRIPLQAVQSLIPRLKAAINDVDQFQQLVASGGQNGTLPNWDILLQRYSLLLGRVNALSTYLSQPLPSTTTTNRPSSDPALTRYLVHPLHPLPTDAGQLAQPTFFEALNTVPIPPLSTASSDLLSDPPWIPSEQLKRMDEQELQLWKRELNARLERESHRAQAVKMAIERTEEEVDWEMRIGVGSDDEDEENEGRDEEEGEGHGHLFGDEPEVVMKEGGEQEPIKVKVPNPREGWMLADYIRYMDTGKKPLKAG